MKQRSITINTKINDEIKRKWFWDVLDDLVKDEVREHIMDIVGREIRNQVSEPNYFIK